MCWSNKNLTAITITILIMILIITGADGRSTGCA